MAAFTSSLCSYAAYTCVFHVESYKLNHQHVKLLGYYGF